MEHLARLLIHLEVIVKRARKRTWTLASLDRSVMWVLWFDESVGRWEVVPIDAFRLNAELSPEDFAP